MKKEIVIIVIILFVVIVIKALQYHEAVTEKHNAHIDYKKALGGIDLGLSYKQLIDLKGEPLKVDKSEHNSKEVFALYYDGIIVYLWEQKDDELIIKIDIISQYIRLGQHKIGIGSSKEEVEKAFERNIMMKDMDFAYQDIFKYCVEFLFDDFDIVTEIKITYFI